MSGRRTFLRTIAAGSLGALAGCSGLPFTGTETAVAGDPSIYLDSGVMRVETDGAVVEGQIDATDIEGSSLEDSDELSPDAGQFRFTDDTDELRFAPGSLRSLAFEVSGGEAAVYRKGELIDRDVEAFSRVFVTPSPSPTGTPSPGRVIDGFERTSLGPYEGSTTAFRIEAGTTFAGQGALAMDRIGEPIHSVAGLPAYPSAGDRFGFAINLGDGRGRGPVVSFRFGVQSAEPRHSYLVNVGRSGVGLRFARRDDRGNVTMDQELFEPPLAEWLLVTVRWGANGSLAATLYRAESGARGERLATATATDRTFTEGGIGWRANNDTGATRYADAVRLLGRADD